MSDGFTKLFGSLIHSTIWREADHVRLVWITMLAMVNRDGVVESSVPGLADAARVSLEQCEEALVKLSSPDKYSRSKEHEGRRIAEADGGWALLNHAAYRKRMSAEDQREKGAARVRKHRAAQAPAHQAVSPVTGRTLHSVTVTPGNESNDIAEADTNTDLNPPVVPLPGDAHAPVSEPAAQPKRSERRKPRCVLPEEWRPNEEHLKRARELGLNCRLERDKFRSHADAAGRVMANWDAAFTTWLLNAQNFAPRGAGASQSRGTALPEEERRLVRNRLLDDAKAGLYGPKAKEWADSGKGLAELADKLEAQRSRPSPAVRQLTEGIGG
jgi:hypothetical protein